MLVDTHVHVWEIDPPRYPVGPTAPTWNTYPDEPGTADELLAEMDEHGVDWTVLVQTSWSTWDNGYVADCAARFPDRLVGHGLIDPQDAGNAAQVRYWVKERGLAGFRFHPMYYPDEKILLTEQNGPMWGRARGAGCDHPVPSARRAGRSDRGHRPAISASDTDSRPSGLPAGRRRNRLPAHRGPRPLRQHLRQAVGCLRALAPRLSPRRCASLHREGCGGLRRRAHDLGARATPATTASSTTGRPSRRRSASSVRGCRSSARMTKSGFLAAPPRKSGVWRVPVARSQLPVVSCRWPVVSGRWLVAGGRWSETLLETAHCPFACVMRGRRWPTRVACSKARASCNRPKSS